MKQNKTILAVFLIMLLSSCHTAKNALNKVKKADLYHPEVVAKYTRDKYPCKAVDSIVKYDTSYDFVEIQCPDYVSPVTDTFYKFVKTKTDLSKVVKPKPIKVVTTQVITKEVVRNIIDSACYQQAESLITENNKLAMTINDKNDWIKWLIIILAISILINFIQARK